MDLNSFWLPCNASTFPIDAQNPMIDVRVNENSPDRLVEEIRVSPHSPCYPSLRTQGLPQVGIRNCSKGDWTCLQDGFYQIQMISHPLSANLVDRSKKE